MSFYETYILPKFLDCVCSQEGFQNKRAQIFPHASGEVLEIGVGTGLNFEFYDFDKVTSVFETYPYGPSKAAVHHLTRVLSAKLVKEDIIVNAIAPGPFPSNMLGPAVGHDYSGIAKANPRGRVGTPEDIAGLTIFLCSRAGAFTVGETITCDGGLVARSGHDLSGG